MHSLRSNELILVETLESFISKPSCKWEVKKLALYQLSTIKSKIFQKAELDEIPV
jgi:hypothetical protein